MKKAKDSEGHVNISIFYPICWIQTKKNPTKIIAKNCIENEYTVRSMNYKVSCVFIWTQEPGHLFYQITGQQSVDQETLMHFLCPSTYMYSLLM